MQNHPIMENESAILNNESSNPTEYLLVELTNSFTHHKHLSDQNNSYLAFYITFLIGSVSIVASFFDKELSDQYQFVLNVIFSITLILNTIIGINLFNRVARVRYAIARHRNKIAWIRSRLSKIDHDQMCGIFDRFHPALENHSKNAPSDSSDENRLKILGAGNLKKFSIEEKILTLLVISIILSNCWFIVQNFIPNLIGWIVIIGAVLSNVLLTAWYSMIVYKRKTWAKYKSKH